MGAPLFNQPLPFLHPSIQFNQRHLIDWLIDWKEKRRLVDERRPLLEAASRIHFTPTINCFCFVNCSSRLQRRPRQTQQTLIFSRLLEFPFGGLYCYNIFSLHPFFSFKKEMNGINENKTFFIWIDGVNGEIDEKKSCSLHKEMKHFFNYGIMGYKFSLQLLNNLSPPLHLSLLIDKRKTNKLFFSSMNE